MLCSRCHKNMAVVFVTTNEGGKMENKGLCLKCAKELGIKPVTDLVEKMGMTDEDIENMSNEIMENFGMNMENMDDPGEESNMATFPFFENFFGQGGGMFPGMPTQESGEGESTRQGEGKPSQAKKDKKRKFLNNYCINLTGQARDGKLDKIIGRDRELARVLQILNRRSKNNPCLIGEPGVGKTAIAEALAQHIVSGDVPQKLQGKELYLLDMTALVAGTQFRGQFESRMKGLLEEVKTAGNVILFVDEVHNLVGAGDAEGAMNAANILKPALSRGEIQMIGATTLVEYRKHIEKDSALERRFQPVLVNEPTVEEAVEILQGVKGYYEGYHGVTISDDIVRQAVTMSERYITDRYLPDKAIDLLDEACSQVNLQDATINGIAQVTKEIQQLGQEREKVLADDYPETDRYQRIADLKSKECVLNEKLGKLCETPPPALTTQDLARVVELWTDIPASKICQQEFVKLMHLEDSLKKRIVGQDEAISLVCSAIRRNRVGISPKKKPVSMIFAGPTGVGKTELVKTMAAELFDSKDSLIRLDMTEFMEKHSVSRLIGAPPGYVGYDDAGQLTEKVRRKPYCVILFDEIEKAHPDVLNILLQILDDGRVSDAHGKKINFENAVIIMTTNAGSHSRETGMGFGRTSQNLARDRVMKALREFLRPEFLNRVDEIVTFNALTQEDFVGICDIMLGELRDSLAGQGIQLRWTDAVAAFLAEKSFDPLYGARNLRRYIEKEIENRIAELLIVGYEDHIDQLVIDVMDGSLNVLRA
jgi:ATP-dependent Clp protease ATP-binding subunit ClpC